MLCFDIDPAVTEASTATLRRLARQATPTAEIPQVDAIRELSTRSTSSATAELLIEVARDGRQTSASRFEAALSLRNQPGDPARSALARLVAGSDETVAIGAARALRAIGDESSLRTLVRLENQPGRSPAVLREVGASATIISHKLRVDRRTFRLPGGAQLIEPAVGDGEEIGHRVLSARAAAAALSNVQPAGLAVGLSSGGRVSEVRCQRRNLLIAPSAHLEDTTVEELMTKPSIPAVIFSGVNLSLERYGHSGYILSKPGRGRSIELAAQNGRGRIWLTGSARPVGDSGLAFDLTGVRTKNSAPVRIKGTFDLTTSAVGFTEARSGRRLDRSRRPAATPVRASG
jgi:hypothetical protein